MTCLSSVYHCRPVVQPQSIELLSGSQSGVWVCPLLYGHPYWGQRKVELALCCSIRNPRKVPITQSFSLITFRSLANAHLQNFIPWDLHCLWQVQKTKRTNHLSVRSFYNLLQFTCRINNTRFLSFSLCFWSHLLFYQVSPTVLLLTASLWSFPFPVFIAGGYPMHISNYIWKMQSSDKLMYYQPFITSSQNIQQ